MSFFTKYRVKTIRSKILGALLIRATPWFVDTATTFLNGFLKWKEDFLRATDCTAAVLEIGGGSSTFYFLQKGISVLCVEEDAQWRNRLRRHALDVGIFVSESVEGPVANIDAEKKQFLHLVPASGLADIPQWVFDQDYFVAVNDGLDRWACLERLLATQKEGILVADNLEYASDWGTLPRGAGWPERAKAWREYIRNEDREWLLFEQPEGRDGHTSPDYVGIEREGRKITGVTWRKSSVAAALGITVTGTCLVSPSSVDDRDLLSLRARCPYPMSESTFIGTDLWRSMD